MRQIARAVAFLAALLPSLAVAQTQLPTLPASTVLGRLGVNAGPAQAIPFAALQTNLPGAALTKTDDTNVTLTLGGTPATALFKAASLTLGWTGQLSVARGGTGSATAAGARTNLGVTATGADTAYAFRANNLSDLANASTARTNLGVAIGSAVEAWDADLDCLAALSGTGILRRTGSGTCSNGTAVANSELATMAAYTLKGNATGSSAVPTDISIPALTHKASPASTDILMVVDAAASNALKYATIAEAVGALASGVSSIDAKTGAFTTSNGVTTVVNDIRLATIATGNMLANASGSTAVPSATKLPYMARATASFTTDATSSTATVYYVKLTGSGAGGGGNNTAGWAAGGGGAGGTCIGTFTGVAAGASVTITTPSGGTGGNNTGTNGANGSASTIAATGITTISAAGGSLGSAAAQAGSPGSGGACTTTSGTGIVFTSHVGGSGQFGVASATASTNTGGSGGNGFYGGGGRNSNASTSQNGGNGAACGAGGGGGASTTATGGDGAAGCAEVTWMSVQ